MGQISRWNRVAEERVTRALACQLGSMELATTVVKSGLVHIGDTHRVAARDVARTLYTAEELLEAAACAGRLTPHKQAIVRCLTADFLDDMLAITDDCAATIIDVLLDP